MKNFFSDLIYPKYCVFCGEKTKNDILLCGKCYDGILQSAPYEITLKKGRKCVVALPYTGDYSDAVKRYKFYEGMFTVNTYAWILYNAVKTVQDVDTVTYVPISGKRLSARGFDQSEILAEKVARLMEVPFEKRLKKCRDNEPQSGMPKGMRSENVAGVYEAVPWLTNRKRTLLIDDIVTTGSTLNEASRTLADAYPGEIVCAALAGTMRGI